MPNQAPTLIGVLTIFGMVVHSQIVFLCTMIVIAATCLVSTGLMVRHEILRCRRLKLIDVRKGRRVDADSPDC